ncbi:MAG: hypothetical protein RL885_33360 [Planctomycetota bacterium]
MKFLYSIMMLGFVLLPSASAQFTNAQPPVWRGEPGTSTFTAWDCYASPFNAPNSPDLGCTADDAALWQVADPAALITSTCNIYSPTTSPIFEIRDTAPGDAQTVVLHVRSVGTPLDVLSPVLVYDLNGSPQIVPFSSFTDLGAPSALETKFEWDLTANPDDITMFTVRFQATDAHLSLDGVQLDVRFVGREALEADVTTLSVAVGGSVQLDLYGGTRNAGQTYLLVGSENGTTPGFTFQGVSVPLNAGLYLNYSAANPNTPILTNTLGTLDGCGEAQASFNLPPSGPTFLVGRTLNHAWIAFDTLGTGKALEASNAVAVTLTQ